MNLRVKLTACVLYLCIATQLKATNYYFSALTGDDSRTAAAATNPATPWQSITKLNSFFASLQPGDSVLFNRGETFPGNIIVSKSGQPNLPIVIAAYGTGANPILSGFADLKSWSSVGNNIWQTTNSSLPSSINVLTVGGQSKALGRYPNADAPNHGYLTYEDHTGNTQIKDNQLSGSPNWTGAQLVIRKNRYIIDRADIAMHSGTVINYNGSSGYDGQDSFGYFIQNNIQALDQPGEWCFDKAQQKLSIYAGNSFTPGSTPILASSLNNIVQIWNISYVKLYGLTISGCNNKAVDIYGSSNIEINNCIINFNMIAVSVLTSNTITIDNSEIADNANLGIYYEFVTNSVVRNSTIKNTALNSGMGASGEDSYQAIIVRGTDNLIKNNVIENTGYIGINFWGDNITIENNLIRNFCFVKDDGGGIYTWTGDPSIVYHGRKVTGNIVVDGPGAGNGTSDSTAHSVCGIYVDETAGYIDIKSNTTANCNGGGIYLHNTNDINARNNTSFNNVDQLLFHEDHNYTIRQNSVYANLFFSKYKTQTVSHLVTESNDISQFGGFDSNYYCRPVDDKFVIETNYVNNGVTGYGIFDLPGWQQQYNVDWNSKITGTQLPPYAITNLSTTNKFSNPAFNTNIDSAVTWSLTNTCHSQWTNGEKLDGGALKVYFDGPNDVATNLEASYLIMHVGSVDASKQYVLRFSLQGSKNQKTFQVYLRKEGVPYNPLAPIQYCSLSTTRTENEFLISFPESQPDASIIFEVNKDGGDFYVDNVRLSEATVSATNPDDYIRFEYNASNNAKSVALDGNQYVDPKNNPFSGNITIAPWSSLILIKKSAIVLPVSFSAFTGKLISDKTVQLDWYTTPPAEGSHFEIERSATSQSFSKIGSLDASKYTSPGSYRFIDASPVNGKNFYRIKEVDPDEKFIYSSVLLVNNGTLEKTAVWPNPAAASININLPSTFAGRKLAVSLESAAGALLSRKELTVAAAQTLSFDLSAYSKGLYVIKIDDNGEMHTYSFIKQ